MNSSIIKRISALAVIIVGLLLGVLTPAGGNSTSWKFFGVALIIFGVIWLFNQRRPPRRIKGEAEPYEAPVMKWYQSAILWVPVLIVVLFLLSLLY
ncbi:hypothetical protein [Pseudidiomarina sp.]|uniref:hypothetical protein n=1 Tax=Pseudidiomarina sp. TaxID=2081707 RepID=UPI00299D6B03|nr:hypothetical protein [Pseudidiomarina sp.]MDX1705687.1 hypothetical protein [Pseudidiomarina sp.]